MTARTRSLILSVYGLLCEFRDSTGAPQHWRLGMFAVVRVE